jgi:hypothetical protein
VATSHAEHGRTSLRRLHELGATGPQFIAIHGVHLDADDITLLAAQGCHVVHCPISNMKLGSGIAPVSALVAGGVNVALGTDGAGSNNRLDLFGEMRMPRCWRRWRRVIRQCFRAAGAVRGDLAGALGPDGEIGSLAAGKQADIVAVDLSTPRRAALLRSGFASRPRRWPRRSPMSGSPANGGRTGAANRRRGGLAAGPTLQSDSMNAPMAARQGAPEPGANVDAGEPRSSPRSPITGGTRKARCSGRCTG